MENAKNLSRRERQIMDAVYSRGEASAAQIRADIPNAPSDSAVRAMLRILEDKDFLKHRVTNGKYIYSAVQERRSAGKGALNGVLRTFFGGSAVQAVAALLEQRGAVSPDELKELSDLLADTRKKGNIHDNH